MNIILESDATVHELKKHYTLLELETVTVPDCVDLRTAYCVLDVDAISPGLLFDLDAKVILHQQFIESFKNARYAECISLLPFLKGQLGDGMDSFYEIIEHKIAAVNTV